MIGVWVTNHEISYTVGKAIFDSLKPIFPDTELCWTVPKEHLKEVADINIGYGILRDMDAVWHKAAAEGKPYFVIDRGYWKPNHYDGYYRISLNGTQQTTGLDRLEPDYERWDALGLEIWDRPTMGYEREVGAHILVCPPTDYVAKFFNIDQQAWPIMNAGNTPNYIYRHKGSQEPIDWRNVREVITFNSSLGWEALRQGIPIISDKSHSILGAYQNTVDNMQLMSIDNRRRFLAIQASLQLRLEEIRSGKIWPLIQRLTSLSGSIVEKP